MVVGIDGSVLAAGNDRIVRGNDSAGAVSTLADGALGTGGEAALVAKAAGGGGSFEAGSDDRDADLIAHVGVDDRAEDDLNIGVSGFANNSSGLVDLVQGEVWATSDVEEDTAGAIDGDIQQLAGDGRFRREAGSVVAFGFANRHKGGAAFGHNGFDIGKIEVDETGDGDEL